MIFMVFREVFFKDIKNILGRLLTFKENRRANQITFCILLLFLFLKEFINSLGPRSIKSFICFATKVNFVVSSNTSFPF